MSHTKLDNFFEDDIKVKLVKDCDLSYFKENGYCDYRIGCDICEVGDAYGFKTNIINIIDNSNKFFYLNNLDLEIKNSWCEEENNDIYLYNYYESNKKNVIKQVYKYYNKFNKLNTVNRSKCNLFIGGNTGTGIAGCFNYHHKFCGDISKIKSVHLCSNCYTWFICINKKYNDSFTHIHPFKIFWKDVVKDYLYDIIEFDRKKKKKLFI